MPGGIGGTMISVMLAVPGAAQARDWYRKALGAQVLWDLGSVVGLTIDGAAFFIAEPEKNGWSTPSNVSSTTARVEIFSEEPEGLLRRAAQFDAKGAEHGVREHQMPWGVHCQGGFIDPFGHIWFVGDYSPLKSMVNLRTV